MDRNMRRSPSNVLALAAAAAATVVLAGRSLAGQISTMEGDINSVHQPPGTGEPSAFTWGDSFDANQVEHLPSTIGVTDGLGSMNVHDPDGGFSWGTQYMLNDPANQPRYIDLTTSTKLLMDISTPGGNPNLPTYSVGFGAINYAFGSPQFPNGLFLDSYNISGGGNFYQFASGPASQTELTTQTYVWDFGREMTANGVPLWAGLNGYVILHFNSNSPAGVPADYYYDHLRVVNVDHTTRPTWQGAGSGSWTDAARWANGVPNAVGAPVIFYGAGDGSVTLNSGVTVGSIVFDSLRTTYDGNDGINTGIPGIGADPNITAPDDPDMAPIVNYTISGTGSLTFDVNSGLAEIYGIVGNHNINVPVTVNDNLDIDMAAGFGPDNNPGLPGGGRFTNAPRPSVTFGSTLSLAAGATLRTRGLGTVTFAAVRGGAGASLVVNGGVTVISSKPTANHPSGTTVVSNLTVVPAARLDLNNNSLIVSSGSLSAITGLIKTGLENGGNFDWGGKGIGSTQANLQNTTAGSFLYGLGVILNDLSQVGGSGPIYTDFAGISGLVGNEVLVKFTYFGDADLSGSIDATDYSLIDNGYVNSLSGWLNGDFDYSGTIDATDYALIDNAYVNQAGPLAEALIAEHARMFGGEYLAALRAIQSGVIPEPATIGLIGCAAMSLRRRRPTGRR